MTWHDFEIAFALVVFAYSMCVLIGLSLRAAYYSLSQLVERWMNR